jgi:hypothetical protein
VTAATNTSRRLEEAAEAFLALPDREQRLVREAAVMGFVQGVAAGAVSGRADAEILFQVLDAARSFNDLYPTLAGLFNAGRGDV